MYDNSYKNACSYASYQGLIVKHPDASELFLDFDTKEQVANFENELYPLFCTYVESINVRKTVSKSGNTHIYITLKEPVTNLERIALQAMLGSDCKREIHSYARHKSGNDYPTLLFETPEEYKKLDEGLDKQAGV